MRRKHNYLALMVQGTGSHVGKSFLCAAFCRAFLRRGVDVAPFKAQNMALNAAAARGGEIGRAQAVQARAARLEPETRMNPVLLKPNGDRTCQVVRMGRPLGTMTIKQLDRKKPELFKTVRAAYRSLAGEHELIVIEGAGSPAEINIRATDYANMRVAAMADARVILAGDIDRGGVFASLFGTHALLTPRERARLMGFVINKFRGDERLLDSGLRFLKRETGVGVLGVVPLREDIRLPEEDSLGEVASAGRARGRKLRLGVVRLPRISNFTDLDPFRVEPDVEVFEIHRGVDIYLADVVILPGSKNVFEDLAALRTRGWDRVLRAARNRKEIIGLCGGLEMLGRTITDPHSVESRRAAKASGLEMLDIDTVLDRRKHVGSVNGLTLGGRLTVHGYEIHHGRVRGAAGSLFRLSDGRLDGWRSRNVWGTFLHGVFDNDCYRNALLNRWRRRAGMKTRPVQRYDVDAAIDRAADLVESSLDVGRLLTRLRHPNTRT